MFWSNRLIATYDVFEFTNLKIYIGIENRLIATYDVFECMVLTFCVVLFSMINSNIRCI